MQTICDMYGYSRQAYYKQKNAELHRMIDEQRVLSHVHGIRHRQPRVGGKKLHRMLQTAGINIGRDQLFCILRENKLLSRRKKRSVKTTNSRHRFRKYKNLIRDLKLTAPNQVYVSDITYIDTLDGFCYLSLMTDAYSRKVVGWDLSNSLSFDGVLRALKMAISQLGPNVTLIHHSDRGIQYCSQKYIEELEKHNIQISMCEENHCYENAIAERVNGILKVEFLLDCKLRSIEIAKELIAQAIQIYNNERLHLSLGFKTPSVVHAA